ncbi:HAD-like protein [Cadophora sp. DSE1049]|nr:HAD-like protein [Cadophora sp. DSE1049]
MYCLFTNNLPTFDSKRDLRWKPSSPRRNGSASTSTTLSTTFGVVQESTQTKIVQFISQQYEIPVPTLKEVYSRILREKTSNASPMARHHTITDERFTSLLASFSLPQDEPFRNELLESYEATLMASLTLKEGAMELLSALKKNGKKIVIITEGPQDAQERTVKALGIGRYIDFLATTNHFGVSKVDGLFPRVLKHLDISPSEMVYIGDSAKRDMMPAMAEGICSIHLVETKEASLGLSPPQINSLKDLQIGLSTKTLSQA